MSRAVCTVDGLLNYVYIIQGGNRPVASSMDDSDDEFDQIVTPDNELDKVCQLLHSADTLQLSERLLAIFVYVCVHVWFLIMFPFCVC